MITPIQFERWQDFALRMAQTAFTRKRRPSAKEIAANVQDYFECLSPEDLLSIVDWDHCDPYPAGCRFYERTYRCPCWHCKGPPQKSDCTWKRVCEDGQIYDYAKAQYPTDHCSSLAERWNPYYWDDLSEAEYDRRDEQFVSPVTCCIRAGLDLAVSQSAGVLGFTVGDLRRMYPEGVPDWVTGGKRHRWSTIKVKGVVPGIGFVPGKPKVNGTFASLPDDAGVWL